MIPQEPSVICSPDAEPDWQEHGTSVCKIVVGKPPRPGESPSPIRGGQLPSDFASRYPNLTHLHLWQITGLKTLPELPECLQCLDLRGCTNLTELPKLPAALELLDIGGCRSLEDLPLPSPHGLKRFYFNDCPALDALGLGMFLRGLKEAPVVEIDGSGTPAVTSLKEFPNKTLKKLVLKECTKLTDISHLPAFSALDHLNLSGCTALEELPFIPSQLRYLALHGANELRLFLGQDIGPHDRGRENQNVVKIFHTRVKFGADLAIMPHAKILFMGDGRVGKTTLAKRLQWEMLGPSERALPKNRGLEPSRDESFTHKVQFWSWETGLRLPEGKEAALSERAAVAKLGLPRTQDGLLEGAVRLWDFGGQEIYHNTHRIFAGEGSIFLLVWRQHPPEPGPEPEDLTIKEWKEWNRQRPLDYWLDYIYSMRPDAKVVLVCTNCPDPDRMPSKPDWRSRSRTHKHRELPAFYVDSLDPQCGTHNEYRRLVDWIRGACGEEALRIGILQPRFFREVSDLVDRWLSENSRARLAGRTPQHLLCPPDAWHDHVRAAHGTLASGEATLDDNDIATITGYLHEAGHLFQIRQGSQRAILVDQGWASDLIYQLLLCQGNLWKIVRENGGWFYRSHLEADPHWKAVENDLQRQQLLAFMEECRVVTRIGDAGWTFSAEDIFLALDKWLLPEYAGYIEARVDEQMNQVLAQPGIVSVSSEALEFRDITLSEFDFRSLQALLAKTFRHRGIYFRNGFQATDNDAAPGWCLRVRWVPEEDDAFAGRIKAVLAARGFELDRRRAEVEDLFFADGSPIHHRRGSVWRRPVDECDLRHGFYRTLRQEEYDIAVSSRGVDRNEAQAMVEALKAEFAGKVNWYRDESCRAGDRRGVRKFMDSLGRQQCIVLLVSNAYLSLDPDTNWYCAWELADAIRRLGDAGRDDGLPCPHLRRTPAQTIVVFKEDERFQFGSFEAVASDLLKGMQRHFHGLYGGLVEESDIENFRHYYEFSRHFLAARKEDVWNRFAGKGGPVDCAIPYDAFPVMGERRDFGILIEKVGEALGKPRRRGSDR